MIDDTFYYAAHLTEKGQLSAPLKQITRENHIFLTTMEYLPTTKKLMYLAQIHWDQIDAPKHYRDYVLATVRSSKLKNFKKADFANISRVFDPDPGEVRGQIRLMGYGPDLAFASVESPFIYFTDNQKMRGQKIDAQGKLSGGSFKAFNSPMNEEQLLWPSAAFSETSDGVRGILVAVETEGSGGADSIWAQVLDKKVKPSGSPVNLFTLADTEEITVGETNVIALPVQPGDDVGRFVW